jgi:hypothetical protein
MTIHEFQARLATEPSRNPLFATLRRLRAFNGPQALGSDARVESNGSFGPARPSRTPPRPTTRFSGETWRIKAG